MSGSFGARLRQRREQRGISLGTIAEQSKIKASLLDALERDDVSRWPTGIFRRAYFRAYADAIGLDSDTALREFLAIHPDPHEVEAATATPTDEAAAWADGSSPPTRIRMILNSAIGAVSRLRRGPTRDLPAVPGPAMSRSGARGRPFRAEDDRDEPPLALPPVESPADRPATPPAGRAPDPDLSAVARLCTEFSRVSRADHVQPLLREAADILGANGLIVWFWNESASHLQPALTHGYSRKVLAKLSPVDREADNPTAAAFRSASIVSLGDHAIGALVVPLPGPTGCVGVLAIELPRGHEDSTAIRAVATIVAAMLAPLVGDDAGAVAPRHRTSIPVPVRLPRAAERSRAASASSR